MEQKTKKIQIIYASFLPCVLILLLSACTVIDNSFCNQSGYPSGTYEYYDCVERYNKDSKAYNHCATIFDFIRESKKQQRCISQTIPSIRANFKTDIEACEYQAVKMIFAKNMYPLQTTKIITRDENEVIILEEIVSESTNVEEIITKRRKLYVNSCINNHKWAKHLRFLD